MLNVPPTGAGGSAVGTPLLHAADVPAFLAIASPLPCAAPIALAAFGATGAEASSSAG